MAPPQASLGGTAGAPRRLGDFGAGVIIMLCSLFVLDGFVLSPFYRPEIGISESLPPGIGAKLVQNDGTKTNDKDGEYSLDQVRSFWPSSSKLRAGEHQQQHLCAGLTDVRFVNHSLLLIRDDAALMNDKYRIEYMRRLKERVAPHPMKILIDYTFWHRPALLDDEERLGIQAEIEAKTNVSTVVYTAYDILERYPSTMWPNVMEPKIWKKFKDAKYRNGFRGWVESVFRRLSSGSAELFFNFFELGYNAFLNFLIHEPSFVWLYEHECRISKTAYKAIWAVEADAVFAGRESQFLEFYEGVDSDLISVFEPFGIFHKDFFGWEVTGDRFPKWPIHKWEHVERYSAEMLVFLDRAFEHNYTAHGEYLSSTLCAMVPQCHALDLREHGFVHPELKGFRSNREVCGELHVALRHCQSLENPDCEDSSVCRCCGPSWYGKWVHSIKDKRAFMLVANGSKVQHVGSCEADASVVFI